MFFSLLFVAAVAFYGVLSEETIARISCDGTYVFGRECLVSSANLSDFDLLEARVVNDTGGCFQGKYYLNVIYRRVYLVALRSCTGVFDIVKIDPRAYNGDCGVNIGSDGFRIIGGLRVPPCQYPWMVWLQRGYYFCSGFIVNKDYIVTSARCVHQSAGGIVPADEIRVTTGSRHLRAGVTRGVEKVFSHPNYTLTRLSNNIAMLKLNESIKFDSCHSPVCIGEDINYVGAARTKCRIMGWGRATDYDSPNNWLRWANETIISDNECKKEFPSSYSNGSVICGEASFCGGDAGGPLVCLDGNKWFAYGIVSGRGGKVCRNGIGLYTHVPFFYDWIQQIIDSP